LAKVRIARELLESRFWPDDAYRVRITGARYEDGFVVLNIEGEGIPKRGYVRPVTVTKSETEFRPINKSVTQ
jgi:hypothetical protein